MKERWFVILFLIQFAIFVTGGAAVGIVNAIDEGGKSWILVAFTTPVFLYLSFRILMRSFAYMGATWAGEAEPVRLDRAQQWHAIIIGGFLTWTSLEVALGNHAMLWKVSGWFATVMSVWPILWGIDEMRRARAQPPDSQPPSEV